MAEDHRCSPLSAFEVAIAAKIESDFGEQLALLHEAHLMLGDYVRALFGGQDVFKRPGLTKQLKHASMDSRKLAVWTLLVGEGYERLNSGRLLLLSGHQSRALACVRDAWESLEWAEICLNSAAETNKWLAGKKVKKPREFTFPTRLPRLLQGKTADIWNTHGTHPYFESVLISVLPATFDDADDQRPYYELTRTGIITSLFVFGLTIEYVGWRSPELEGASPGRSDLVKRIGTVLRISLVPS